MAPPIRPLSLHNITITDGFWKPRLDTNRLVTLDHQYEHIKANGCLDNFRRVFGEAGGEFEGPTFIDANAYKWLEAASYALTTHDMPTLSQNVAEVITLLEHAQDSDGYLFTYLMLKEPEKRWRNFSMMHELYCAGHLIEAAVAHHRATDSARLLNVATKFADLIDRKFGPDGAEIIPGHEEIELALLKLATVTGKARYRDLARVFIERRGRQPSPLASEFERTPIFDRARDHMESTRDDFLDTDGNYDGRYAQDHAPIRAQETIEGHAVRATNLYAAVASLLADDEDEELADVVERVWENMISRRMYVTGGIGSSADNEGFTEDFDLPNDTAFAETCAAAGCVFWGQKMFELTGQSKYIDTLERSLYNALLVGVSLDGTRFFYSNPLRSDGSHRRKQWLYVACCPPNVARVLASLGKYVYCPSPADDSLYVNLYVNSETRTELAGEPVRIDQSTDYPWDGTAEFTLSLDEPVPFTLRFRLPSWAADETIRVNGTDAAYDVVDGYAVIDRTWADGDRIELSLPMTVDVLAANPEIDADVGRVALQRGPIVYCLEAIDNPTPLDHLSLGDPATFTCTHRNELLGGLTVIEGEGKLQNAADWETTLYRSKSDVETESVEFTAIPYYGWSNRSQGGMAVWIPNE